MATILDLRGSEVEYSKSHSRLMSEDIRQIAQALGFAKREFRSTGKSARNDHQKYSYAKLDDIYGAVEEALDHNSIIIVHHSEDHPDGKELLETRLIHWASGQFIADRRWMVSEKPGNQGKGAACTYMSKYAVLSLCAIAPEDDDGQGEQKHLAKEISGKSLAKVQDAIRASASPAKTIKALLEDYKCTHLYELYESEVMMALKFIADFKGGD